MELPSIISTQQGAWPVCSLVSEADAVVGSHRLSILHQGKLLEAWRSLFISLLRRGFGTVSGDARHALSARPLKADRSRSSDLKVFMSA